jgi:hypothetical protein
MRQKTAVFAALSAALFLGSTMGVGCGGRLTPPEGEGTGGSGGAGGTSGSAGNDGTGGSTGGVDGTGGSTGGVGGTGGSTGGVGGTGGSTGGVGGTGGSTGGTGGRAGSGGTAGSDAGPGAIMCGVSICRPVFSSLAGTLPPCCPSDTPNVCGAIIAVVGTACFTATPGVVDSKCPPLQTPNVPLPGCCRPNGMCGIDMSVVGLGCNDPTLVGAAPAFPCSADGGRPPASMGMSDTDTSQAPTQ